jgi:transposase InsO family protein
MGRTLRDSKIMAGMGSKGDPWDNASAESCISTIKNELVNRRTFDLVRRAARGRLAPERSVRVRTCTGASSAWIHRGGWWGQLKPSRMGRARAADVMGLVDGA